MEVMSTPYTRHRDALNNLVASLVALDLAETPYCKADCSDLECDDEHVYVPDGMTPEKMWKLRQMLAGAIYDTSAALATSDEELIGALS